MERKIISFRSRKIKTMSETKSNFYGNQSPPLIAVGSHEALFGELANFYRTNSPIIYQRKPYPTAEHLFHSLKYMYPGANPRYLEYAERIRNVNTPYQAKILGKQLHYTKYAWQRNLSNVIKSYSDVKLNSVELDNRRYQIMYIAIKSKMEQNEHCQNVLLATGNNYIVKLGHDYWGINPDGSGQNKIGEILMIVRNELRSTK